MNRREWLKRMSALAVGAVAAPSLLAVFDAYAAAQRADTTPPFFTKAQSDLMVAVVDIILPPSDTPGAVEAGVPRFIDRMFRDVYTKEEQQHYVQALDAFEEASSKPFLQLDATQRKALVTRFHEEALVKGNLKPASAPAFVLTTKKLAMLGFFMSQPGCTEVLQYVAVPGAYHADIPLSQAGNGRAWAIETELTI